MKCPRCGERYDMIRVGQTRCPRCEAEVQRIVEADEQRRAPRFTSPKDLTARMDRNAA